jgi:membrane dipeptidase
MGTRLRASGARSAWIAALAALLSGCDARRNDGAAQDAASEAPPSEPLAPPDYSTLPPDVVLDSARELHRRILTLDSHADIPFDYATAAVNPCTGATLQVDVPKMRAGGLGAVVLSVWVPQAARTEATYARAREQAMAKFRAIHRFAEEMCPAEIEIATTPDDVKRIGGTGKLVVVIGIENGFAIGKDVGLVATYKELGAAYMSLTHSAHNDLADSSLPREALGDAPSEHDGVSALGEQVIAEMNRVGMMVDVSHASKSAALDAMRLSRAPVVASHSSVRAVTNHVRNMDDETLLALRDEGGVIQITALGDYVRPPGGRAPTVSALVDHIDHAVNLIGIDHVGISSDFDGGGGIEGWRDASETLNVTAELLRRGYGEQHIAKLWGENFLRVWREAVRVAREG